MDSFARNRTLISLCALGILIFSGYILFYKLGNEPFQDYDEATYALVTHASLEQGVPTGLSFLNTPYLRKPPLLFWMTTASARVFKDPEFADRFPSALAGLAALVMVALIGVEAGGGVWTGIAAAAILATVAAWMEPARNVRFDNLVAFFDAAALYAALRTRRDSRWFVMVGITLALAVLSKSAFAFFGGVAVLAVLIYERSLLGAFRNRQLWFGVGAFLLVVAPWHIYMTFTQGAAFWQSYLGTEVFHRAATNLFPGGGNPTNAQYFKYLLHNAGPWSEAFVLALLSAPLWWRRASQTARTAFVSGAAAALSVLLVTFVSSTKAYGYLVPLFPFMAVSVALAGWHVIEWVKGAAPHHAATVVPLCVGALIVIFATTAAYTRYEALHIDTYYNWEVSQAYEERAVGQIIAAAPDPEAYAYDGYDFLGSIYYYSGLPDTSNPYILLWSASSTPSATSTSFILATSSLQSLSSAFPQYQFVQDYSGRFVSLFTVAAR